MRRWLLLLALALGLVVLPTSAAATTGISITSTGFHPSAVTVAYGDTVTWTNDDALRHQVVANTGAFASPVLAPKQTWSHTFKTGGTFGYHDGVHPALRGTLTVIPARTVWIMSNGFVPPTLSIKAGQSVTWVNKTNANQQVVADDASFASLVLAPGATFTHTFPTGGTFGYHDALQPSFKGTVVVTTPPPGESITLESNSTAAVYGGALVLNGTVTNGTAGEKVTITANPQSVAGKTFKSTQTVTTDSNGNYTATVQPLVHTVYVASTGKSTSDPLAINVRPRLRIGWISHRRLSVRAYAVRSFFHKYGYVQMWRSRAGAWSTIARFRFTSSVNSVSPTVITRALVRMHVRHRLRLRVFMPFSQTRPGYISGFSNAVRS